MDLHIILRITEAIRSGIEYQFSSISFVSDIFINYLMCLHFPSNGVRVSNALLSTVNCESFTEEKFCG